MLNQPKEIWPTHAPLISVVLTTYNRASVLASTIDSILSQSFRDFELLICDDHSVDNTREIVDSYCKRDSRVSYLGSSTRLYQPGNLNRGVAAAGGRYVANLHDGDIYDSRLLEKWFLALEECPNAGFVFNAYIDLGEWHSPGYIVSLNLPKCSEGSELLRIYYHRWRFDSPVWGTTMVRRSVYERLGTFDEQYGFISDVDMWLRIAENYCVAYVDEPLISLPTRKQLPKQYEVDAVVTTRPFHLRRTVHKIVRRSRLRTAKTRYQRVKHELIQLTFVSLDYCYLSVLTVIKLFGLYSAVRTMVSSIPLNRRKK